MVRNIEDNRENENLSKINVAVVGATGVVGREIIKIIGEGYLPVNNVYALASYQSKGKKISMTINKQLEVHCLDEFDFKSNKVDIAFFCAGSEISKKYAEKVASEGCIVIDKSSLFRMDKDVPLIVPEVNLNDIKKFNKKNIIATPNCTTIPLAMCLKPLDDNFKIKRVVVTTFQSVSGSGKKGMDELYNQTKGFFEASVQNLSTDTLHGEVYSKQIAFNCIPQCDTFSTNGSTKEEDKIVNEIAKILGKKLPISAMCVRVPVFRCHGESVNIEFEKNIEIEDIVETLSNSKGLIVSDRQEDGGYYTQVECVGEDCAFVSRIKRDMSVENGINFWLVVDNVRKGSALNGVQIANELIKLL